MMHVLSLRHMTRPMEANKSLFTYKLNMCISVCRLEFHTKPIEGKGKALHEEGFGLEPKC